MNITTEFDNGLTKIYKKMLDNVLEVNREYARL